MDTELIPLRTARIAVIGLALVYCAAHLAWFGATPMGAYPVLDGRELLELAKAIGNGGLPHEPFYRAPLYPALIALWVKLGVAESFLPDGVRLTNLALHVASAAMVFEVARRMWSSVQAGMLAGLLYGLYPVALDFAGDPLDITLGTTLAIAGTLSAMLAVERNCLRQAILAAAWFSLAALARPNFLVCLPALLLWLAIDIRVRRQGPRLLLGAVAGSALILLSMGVVNQWVGGEFRILPWQGSHGMWDANGPGANGLFYSHSIDVPDLVPGSNPARAEAEILYCRDRPCGDRLDIDDFQRYWRDRMRNYAAEHPLAIASLLASKAYYLLNNYEQYNNKTYWFHKDRSPWLRWNPLGWAILLALGIGALWLPAPSSTRRLILLVSAAYACSLLIYFVSARFRVPLVVWLSVLAGGWAAFPAWLRGWRDAPSRLAIGRQRIIFAVVTALLVVAVAAIPVNEQLKQGTVTEDWMLMSSASLAAGDWKASEDWAARVLERLPERTIAHAMICSARLYAWEKSPGAGPPPRTWLEDSLRHCSDGAPGSDRSAYNASFFLAGLCQRKQAIALWEQLRDSKLIGELARNALSYVGQDALRADDEVTGLRALNQASNSEILPGQRSMMTAIDGRLCPN